jgi:lysophospholipase L1-like esterase
MTHPSRARWPATAVAALTALVTVACAESPALPTAPGAVLAVASAPQTGAPVPAGDPLPAIPALGATRFLAFGDSITCGVSGVFPQVDIAFDSTCFNTGYPEALDGLLEAASATQDFTVDNEGRPGEEARLALSRFTSLVSVRRPQAVLLLEGINDLNSGTSVSSAVAAMQQMVDVARAYGATVLLGTMFQTCYSVNPYTGRVRTNSTALVAPFNSALRAMVAGRENVYVVSVDTAFGNANCGSERGINLVGEDGLHPSPSGYSAIAQTFGMAIRSVFAVRGSYQ